MDELIEGFDIVQEAFPEYWASLVYAAKSWPVMMAVYSVVALAVVAACTYMLARKSRPIGHAFTLLLVIALFVLPGAVGNGGLVFLPVALSLATGVAMSEPMGTLLYNASFIGIAIAAAFIFAVLYSLSGQRQRAAT